MSWNIKYQLLLFNHLDVSLFVRLWVEIIASPKENVALPVSLFVRLWVEISHSMPWKVASSVVSLFVRLWVEMTSRKRSLRTTRVSLFVRLWVEMSWGYRLWDVHLSASSWGCELKYSEKVLNDIAFGQPLREAVSWNNTSEILSNLTTSQPLREAVSWNTDGHWCATSREESASSWGCELKYWRCSTSERNQSSASSWGCELKYPQDELLLGGRIRQPLREAVSWNNYPAA